jgi:hypothetical protein
VFEVRHSGVSRNLGRNLFHAGFALGPLTARQVARVLSPRGERY